MAGQSASRRGKALKGLISVVIPVEPAGSVTAVLEALKHLPQAEKGLLLEVLVAEGANPSRQRNLAVAKAKAAWVLFIDSDSQVQPGALPALMAATGPGVVAVGGPNLAMVDEPPLGRAFDRVLASWFGSMASRARYTPVGERRDSGEKELILCNLLVERQAFVQAGGFREDLYPNEENELFNRWQAQGKRLVYEPRAQVRRPRRGSVPAFIYQAFRYGRGRSQQMRSNFFVSDLFNLLPLSLPVAWGACFALRGTLPYTWALPAAYAPTALLFAGFRPDIALYLILRQHAYAVGLVAGLVQNTPPRLLKVSIRRVQP